MAKEKDLWQDNTRLDVVPEGIEPHHPVVKRIKSAEDKYGLGADFYTKMNDYDTFDEWWAAKGLNVARQYANKLIKDKANTKGYTGNIEDSKVWLDRRNKVEDAIEEHFKSMYKQYNMTARKKELDDRKDKSDITAATKTAEKMRDEATRVPGAISRKKVAYDDGRYARENMHSNKRSRLEGSEKFLKVLHKTLASQYGDFDPNNPEDTSEGKKKYDEAKRRLAEGIAGITSSKMTPEEWTKVVDSTESPFVIRPDSLDRKRYTLTVQQGDDNVWRLSGPKEVEAFLSTVPRNRMEVHGERTATNKWVNALTKMLDTGDQDYYYKGKEEEKVAKVRDDKTRIDRYLNGEDMSNDWKWADRELAKEILGKLERAQNDLAMANSAFNSAKILFAKASQDAADAMSPKDKAKAEKAKAKAELQYKAAKTAIDNVINGYTNDAGEHVPGINELKASLPEKLDYKECILDQLGVKGANREDLLMAPEGVFKDYVTARKIINDNKTTELKQIDVSNAVKNVINKAINSEQYDAGKQAEQLVAPLLSQLESSEDGNSAEDIRQRIEDFQRNIESLKLNATPDVANILNKIDLPYDLSGADGLKNIAMNITALDKFGLTDAQKELIKQFHNKDIEAGMNKTKYTRETYGGRSPLYNLKENTEKTRRLIDYQSDAANYAAAQQPKLDEAAKLRNKAEKQEAYELEQAARKEEAQHKRDIAKGLDKTTVAQQAASQASRDAHKALEQAKAQHLPDTDIPPASLQKARINAANILKQGKNEGKTFQNIVDSLLDLGGF